jgi:exocyst complex component 4
MFHLMCLLLYPNLTCFFFSLKFNSVDLALQLLDDSSLGKDMDSFRRTKNMLSKALKGSVDRECR